MPTTLPDSYAAAHPTLDDAEAIVELVNASSMADMGIPIVSLEQVRSLWQLPGHDSNADDWLVTAPDGSLAGVASVFALEPFSDIQSIGVTRPEHEGRGIGTWLLERVEARAGHYVAAAPAGEAVQIQTSTWSANERAATLLGAHGFQLARVFRVMTIDFDAPLPPVAPPTGITFRTFVRGQDEFATWQADEESFCDHWNHRDIAQDVWEQLLISGVETFDPTLWWLALDGDEVAGVALCDAAAPSQPDYGWVASLGVRRPWRGRGVGKALLQTAFAEFQRRGKRGVSLGVDADSPTGANRLYERAGMHVTADTAVYAKELRAAE